MQLERKRADARLSGRAEAAARLRERVGRGEETSVAEMLTGLRLEVPLQPRGAAPHPHIGGEGILCIYPCGYIAMMALEGDAGATCKHNSPTSHAGPYLPVTLGPTCQ
jgi:hypothetical protein